MHFHTIAAILLAAATGTNAVLVGRRHTAPVFNGTSCLMRATISDISIQAFIQLNSNNQECDCTTPFFPEVTNCTVGMTNQDSSAYINHKVSSPAIKRDFFSSAMVAKRDGEHNRCGSDFYNARDSCANSCSVDADCEGELKCFNTGEPCSEGGGSGSSNGENCGGGSWGNGICDDTSLCCSQWGYCGTGSEFCSSTGNDWIVPEESFPASSPEQPQQQQPEQQQEQPQQPQQEQPQPEQPQQPSAPSAPSGGGGSLSPQNALDSHNSLRSNYLSPPAQSLSWDSGLENLAQIRVNFLASIQCQLIHGDLPSAGGQNLIMWASAPNAPSNSYTDAAQAWWNEGAPSGGGINHFSVMSTASYSRLGCAYAVGDGGPTNVGGLGNYQCLVIACDYS
ncbi:CAP domain-containing protein [Chytriomyces cf. hyalinus JEL632]|nr:CAP domain-containing protein [Chytriomyces cf. hyalinus JEL632]